MVPFSLPRYLFSVYIPYIIYMIYKSGKEYEYGKWKIQNYKLNGKVENEFQRVSFEVQPKMR